MTELTHHAYFIEGSLARFDEYTEALKPWWANVFERFGIDEARELIELAALKNFSDAIFFVGASSITIEAQQALLKLLEEPQRGSVFVFLVPHGALVPTVRSRMLPYPLAAASASSEAAGDAKKFLKMSGKERSDFIMKLLKDDEGVRERVRDLLLALEAELLDGIRNEKTREALADISMVRSYVSDRSPSLKMLLEHLALSLPTM